MPLEEDYLMVRQLLTDFRDKLVTDTYSAIKKRQDGLKLGWITWNTIYEATKKPPNVGLYHGRRILYKGDQLENADMGLKLRYVDSLIELTDPYDDLPVKVPRVDQIQWDSVDIDEINRYVSKEMLASMILMRSTEEITGLASYLKFTENSVYYYSPNIRQANLIDLDFEQFNAITFTCRTLNEEAEVLHIYGRGYQYEWKVDETQLALFLIFNSPIITVSAGPLPITAPSGSSPYLTEHNVTFPLMVGVMSSDDEKYEVYMGPEHLRTLDGSAMSFFIFEQLGGDARGIAINE
jgi:hypothetical protein